MPFLSPLSDDRAGDHAGVLFERIRQSLGEVPNLYRTLAHAPDLLAAVIRLGSATHKELPAKLRELAYLITSMVNQCDYCVHYHTQAALRHGVTQQQLDEIRQYWDSDLFSPIEKAVLKFADELTRDVNINEGAMNQLKAELTEAQLVELAATVGMANFVNRINEAFAIELP